MFILCRLSSLILCSFLYGSLWSCFLLPVIDSYRCGVSYVGNFICSPFWDFIIWHCLVIVIIFVIVYLSSIEAPQVVFILIGNHCVEDLCSSLILSSYLVTIIRWMIERLLLIDESYLSLKLHHYFNLHISFHNRFSISFPFLYSPFTPLSHFKLHIIQYI